MKFQEVNEHIMQPNLAKQTMGEIFTNKKVWDSLPDSHKRILIDCTTATSEDCNAWFRYYDFIDMELFKSKYNGKIVQMDPETVSRMRSYSVGVIDEYSQNDPKYCGKVGELMHEFLKVTGKVKTQHTLRPSSLVAHLLPLNFLDTKPGPLGLKGHHSCACGNVRPYS